MGRVSLCYRPVDPGDWLDVFQKCSSIMQYAIFFANRMVGAGRFVPPPKLREKIKTVFAALVKERRQTIEKKRAERLQEIAGEFFDGEGGDRGGGGDDPRETDGAPGVVVDSAKRVLEEEAVNFECEKKLQTLENGAEFLVGLLTGASDFDGEKSLPARGLLAKFALDGFKQYLGQNYIWEAVLHVFLQADAVRARAQFRAPPYNRASRMIMDMKRTSRRLYDYGQEADE